MNEMVRKNSMVRRLAAVALAAVLVVGLSPSVALAKDDSESSSAVGSEVLQGEGSNGQDDSADTPALIDENDLSGSGVTLSAQADTDSSTSTSTDSNTSSSHVPTVTTEHSLVWANTAEEAKEWFGDEQAVLANGTADVISVTLTAEDGGTTLTAAELAAKTTSDSAYYLKGVLCAPAGSTVTMRFTPARGYQLKTNAINGGTIAITALTDEGKTGQYTFSMPEEGYALDCGFATASDEVDADDASAVASGTISNADSVISSGTLLLELEDISDSAAKKKFDSKAGSNTVVSYIDTKLSNVVNQGLTSAMWKTALAETSSAITLTFKLSDSAVSGASAFYIIREVGGEYQQANVTYDSSAKTITFKTNKFESYAIVKGTSSSSSSTSSSSSSSSGTTNSSSSATPKTGDTNNPALFAASAIASAALAVFALRRMRRV